MFFKTSDVAATAAFGPHIGSPSKAFSDMFNSVRNDAIAAMKFSRSTSRVAVLDTGGCTAAKLEEEDVAGVVCRREQFSNWEFDEMV
jgi:hypothetical protein